MCTKFLVGFVTAGFVLSPFAYAADRPQKKNRVDDDMAQAIAFERQKDAAAARQARIEAKHPTVTYANTEADRDNSKADKDGEEQSKQEKRK
jgi:hypothetical protein